jgi:hypothetical protein
VLQVHIAGLIITPIKNGKQSDVTYINIIKHADEFDLPVVARRLFSDHMVSAQPPVWLHHPLALLCRSGRTTTQAAARSPSAAGLCVLAQVPNVMEGIVKKIKMATER